MQFRAPNVLAGGSTRGRYDRQFAKLSTEPLQHESLFALTVP